MDYRLLTARSSNIPRRDGSPLLRVDKTGPELRSSPRLALIREAAANRVQALAVTRVPAGLAPPLGARLSPSILVGIPAGATEAGRTLATCTCHVHVHVDMLLL